MNNPRIQTGIYTLIALGAGALVGLNQVRLMPIDQLNAMLAQVGSLSVLALIAGVQTAVLALVSSLIGLRLAPQVGLQTSISLTRAGATVAIGIATVLAVVIVYSDVWIFAPYLPTLASESFHWLGLISSVLYGGIVEEILLRLFVMTLIVWIIGKLFGARYALQSLPAWVYVVAIALSSLLFAAGHLPVTFALLCPVGGDCTPLIIRAMLLNSIGGIGFGYLYWRHGLTTAMLAHMVTHVVMQGLVAMM